MVDRSRQRANHRDGAIARAIKRQIVDEERTADLREAVAQLGHDRR
jgi:hypothetical protein